MTTYNRVLEQYVDTPIDADAAHVPAGKRLALLAQLEREMSEPITTEVPV